MDEGHDSLIEFPCHYEVKVMGLDGDDFHAEVRRIVAEHTSGVSDDQFRRKASSKGKYTSVSVTVFVESHQHLEALYMDLRACDQVLYTL